MLARQKDCGVLVRQQEEGALPMRVTHNDTKLNNILFDELTGRGLCIIDLDTIMPGLAANDFGDSIRFGAATAEEDEQDLDKMHFDISLYELYVKGYLEETKDVLTPAEIRSLPWGARLMTLECGIRFLTDTCRETPTLRRSIRSTTWSAPGPSSGSWMRWSSSLTAWKRSCRHMRNRIE